MLTHNVWVADWPVIITMLGWLTAIAGAIRIVAPEQVQAWGRRCLRTSDAARCIGAAIWLALGAVLTFFGYIR